MDTDTSAALAAIAYAARVHAGANGLTRSTEAGYNRAGKLLLRYATAHGRGFAGLVLSEDPARLLRLAASQSADGRCRVGVGYFAALQRAVAAQGSQRPPAPARRSRLLRLLRL